MKDLKGTEISLGPITKEESDLLTAITRMIAAENVLEFGYFRGASAKAFLSAMPLTAKIISLDILDRSEYKLSDNRLTLLQADMTNFDTYILPENLDIVFFDASHNLEDNQKAFELIKDKLSTTLIIIHDTGYWDTSLYTNIPWDLSGIVPHRPDEIQFVEWLKTKGYNAINFSTIKEFRCGLTVLQ